MTGAYRPDEDRPVSTHSSGKKLNIICVAGWWPVNGSLAGIFIKEHVLAIARLHHVEVVYLSVVRRNLPGLLIEHSVEDGIPVHRITISTPIRRFGVYDLLCTWAYRKILDRLSRKRKIDLVHVHVRTEETKNILPAAKKHGLPIVVTEHNTFYHRGIRKLEDRERKIQIRAIHDWLNDAAIKAVMPVSKELAVTLETDLGVPGSKLHVVPNIAADVFTYRQKPPIPPFVILLAALWRDGKDHDVLLDSLKYLPKEQLGRLSIVWCGDGPNLGRIKERCRIEFSHVAMTFHGNVSKPRLADEMMKAHLFVLPTTAENLPCVIIESLCTGTPVVSMQVNGVPELVDASNGILVPPSDARALADAISRFMDAPNGLDGVRIAQAARQRFSAGTIAGMIDRVYRDSLAD